MTADRRLTTIWGVKVPGKSRLWSTHKTLKAAHRECKRANRLLQSSFQVFAYHQDGHISGPLIP